MMDLRFEHRSTDASPGLLDRVWSTRSDRDTVMTSAARTSLHLIVARTPSGLAVGLRGPETKATIAPVPGGTEYVGVRFAVGAVLPTHPASTLVDGYSALPVTDRGRIVLGGQEWEAPTFESVEQFVQRLHRAGLLVPSELGREPERRTTASLRTRQRRFREFTGLSRTAAAQIDRANDAAMMLRSGARWGEVVDALGFFDQAHLGHALRRFVGHTARELQSDGSGPMSFLYKTGARLES